MKRTIISVVVTAVLALPTIGFAMDKATEKRIEALEERQQQLFTNLQEEKARGVDQGWMDRFTFGGEIDIRASYASFDGGDDESDIILDTALLAVAAQVNDVVVAEIALLAEEDDGIDFTVDEAFLAYKDGVATAGLFYIPFGAYNSFMVTDPLTLDLGESQEVALMLGYGTDLFSVAAFVYNGDADENGKDNHINDFGASLIVTPMDGVELGVSSIKDLADSDGIDMDYVDEVAGISAYGLVEFGPFAFTAEVVSALDEFDAADDVAGDGTAAQPFAYNVEAAYTINDKLTAAARIGGSDEIAELNETQYGVTVAYGVMENITVAAEYLHGENDDDSDSDTFTLQLAAEF